MSIENTSQHDISSMRRKVSTLVLLLIGALMCLAVVGTFKLKTQYSLDQFVPKSHPLIRAEDQIKKIFHLPERVSTAVVLSLPKQTDKWTEPQRIRELSKLTRQISDMSGIEGVLSLDNIETAVSSKDTFEIGRMTVLAKQGLDWVYNDPLLSPYIVSKSGRDTVLFIQTQNLSIDKYLAVLGKVEHKAKAQIKDVQVAVGGPTAVRTHMTNIISAELVRFMGLSLLCALGILMVMFRGWSAPVVAVVLVFSANLMVLGWMAYMSIPFTVLSTTIPVLVSISAVAICVHTLVRVARENINVSSRDLQLNNLFRIMRELALPHLLTACTTGVGFATLIPSEVQLISQYGLSVTVAVFIACLTTLILLPSLAVWLPLPSPRGWSFRTEGAAQFILQHRRVLLPIIVIFTLLSAFFGRNLNWSGRLYDDLPKDHKVRLTTEYIDKNLGGIVPLHIVLQAPSKKQNWRDQNLLANLDKAVQKIRDMQGVGSVLAITDFLKAASWDRRLPKNSRAVAETLFIYGMTDDDQTKGFLSADHNWTRVYVRMQDIAGNQSAQVIKKIERELMSSLPGAKLSLTGTAKVVPEVSNEISNELIVGCFYALAVIVFMLVFVFRSLRWALLAAIPNLVPPAILLGTLALAETPIKPGIALIFSISLGIAFDNTIYVLSRLQLVMKRWGDHYGYVPIKEVLTTEMSPCLISSLTLMTGFSIFMFSYFSMNQIFGAYMLLSIISGLIGDLVLLPILVHYMPYMLPLAQAKPVYEQEPNRLPAVIYTDSSEIYGAQDGASLEPQVESEKLNGSTFMKTAASLFLCLMTSFMMQPVAEAKVESADAVLKRVEKKLAPPSEQVFVKMTMTSAEGKKKTRSVLIRRKNSEQQAKALVRLIAPADLKGMGVLSLREQDTESQWLYLPSSKQSRRLASGNKSSKFLDSDLTYADLSANTYKQFKNNIVQTLKKKNDAVVVISSQAKSGADVSYHKIKTWVSTVHDRIQKVEYYDNKDDLIKTMTFSNYKLYGNQYWRAHRVEVKDMNKKSKTVMEVKKASIQPLADSLFTRAALEDE